MKFDHLLPALFALCFLAACSRTDDADLPPAIDAGDDGLTQGTATPCENGFAGEYPCSGYDLQSRIPLRRLQGASGNDVWGWTDPVSGKEYALMGVDNGTTFVDISDAESPIYLGKLPTRTVASPWRDIKVYGNHAYIVSEAPNHGLQVFDLTRLRNLTAAQTFTADAVNLDFGSAHNVVINEDEARVYVVGAETFKGGIHIIDITDPQNPTTLGGYDGDGYTHDAQVVTYSGPDLDYTGRQICVASNEDSVTIIDVTNVANPVFISKMEYANAFYTHQGWFSEDQRYFIANDELDELRVGFNTRSLVFDFSDLDNPVEVGTYAGPTRAIDHNYYVKGNTLYLSNYSAGLRILDISDIGNANFMETGFFDTYPASNVTGFEGAWSNYPYFASGNIIISDIEGGLFVIKKSN
ncbi:choice-of-anchor B family protein [Leeuwenhoekiella sp. H156]|uniref:choice-of-anchor B family protein n=1 Tax=Leeuwenhoekiella sp. H156 TaxID=3450128 RepID=UPI003FA4CC56